MSRHLIQPLAPGTYQLCGQLFGNQTPIQLAELLAYPQRQADPGTTGQWLVSHALRDAATAASARVSQIFVATACRLGLLAHRLAPAFVERLRVQEPLCLLADTSALYHGIFEQALRLRRSHPTHVAFPDQAWMELQRQREEAAGKASPLGAQASAPSELERWLNQVNGHRRHFTGTRVLQRIRAGGVIVHHARPPDAMVRYFGAERGSGAGDEAGAAAEADIAAGYYRDRLILEAARELRSSLSGMAVVLVTADSNLAAHAHAEGFTVGFGQFCAAPEPFLLSSPFFDPYDLALRHVAVEQFLEELLWQWRSICLRRAGDPTLLRYELPRGFDLTLLELSERVEVSRTVVSNQIPWRPQASEMEKATEESMELPRTAPSPADLITGLLAPEAVGSKPEGVRSYLAALGWASQSQEGRLLLTPRGAELAAAWRALTASDVLACASWLARAGRDIAALRNVATLLQRLHGKGLGLHKSNEIERLLDLKEKPGRSLRVLAHAFGLLINLNGKVSLVQNASLDTAEGALLQNIPADGIRVDRLFTLLAMRAPMSAPLFRAALASLVNKGSLRTSGTYPDQGGGEGTSRVSLELVVPTDKGAKTSTFDLGAGDFLPGTNSVQTVYPAAPGAQ